MKTHDQDKDALLDPVCGMSVTPASEHHHAFNNTDYYFCSSGCREKFAADPGHYLKPSKPAPAATGIESLAHICPMCPEVRQTGPGACPSCGMALEPEVI
ncbi:MAG: YHS domain-containing protein, partial [Gammaproteobacteria bacterium]|nr:YHS domain-containing protein [Gammaproteobacteria bacterium]